MPPSERTPVVYVALDGSPASAELSRRVLSLEVDEELRKATSIKLVLSDVDGSLRAREALREGQTIGVRWGYHGALLRIRAGVIHRVDPKHEDDRIEVEALGRELALSVGPVRRVFRGQTFRDAAGELAREASLRVDWQAGEGVRFDAQVIDNEHAWRWLLDRSGEQGLEVGVEGDALVVCEPRLGQGPDLGRANPACRSRHTRRVSAPDRAHRREQTGAVPVPSPNRAPRSRLARCSPGGPCRKGTGWHRVRAHHPRERST